MITAPSANYTTVYNDPSHYAEVKLLVGDSGLVVVVDESKIISLSTSISLLGDSFDIGNVIVNSFTATLVGVNLNRLAPLTKVEIWARLKNESSETGWFPKGVFYIKKPAYDPETGIVKIEGYDPLYTAELTPYPTGTIVQWENMTMRTVATTMATTLGLPLENSTQVDAYDYPAPPYGYTAREILSQIAIACGGNWMLTYVDTSPDRDNLQVTPKLRLRKITDTVATQDLARTVQSFTKGSSMKQITHVILDYGTDSNGATLCKEAVAQTDNGRTIEYEIPTITDGDVVQDIADDLLDELGDISYDPFSATGAMLNPLMEVGDGVTCNSCTAFLGAIDTEFGKGMFASISSPGIPEEDDFPYMTTTQRSMNRVKRNTETNSARITVNANAIVAEVARAQEVEGGLTNTITSTADGLRVELQRYTTNALGDHITQQAKYIRYGMDGLELGDENAQTKAILTEERLSFISPDGDEKAYIGRDNVDNIYKFFVINGHIVNQLELGDHWILVANSNDNGNRLTFKWRG